jgi:DNA ligase (NAD+)
MEVPYANPRNLASGTLRRVKSSKVAEVPLDIFVYEGYFQEKHGSHIEIMHRLGELNFKLNPNISYFSDDESLHREFIEKHKEWDRGRTENLEEVIRREESGRKDLDYEIDGLVLKVNELGVRDDLGYTGHHPRWAMAFKFESPEGISVIKQIDLQVGRTGRVTPVARIEPVEIAGSTVSNVTLHNQEYIEMLEVAVGDRVAVSKRGEIIPAVERVIEPNDLGNKTFTYPETCPSCGSSIEKDGAHHFCRNSRCPEQVKGRIHFFVSRNNMDIENLGPETLNLLIEKELVKDIQDIYSFDPGKLEGVAGFGERKIRLIKEGIEKSKGRPYETVLQSIGIPEIGQKVIELLVEAGYRDIDSLIEFAKKGDPYPLLAIHGIGEKTAETIINELTRPDLLTRIEELRRHGLNFVSESTVSGGEDKDSGIFSGETWCVTGSFQHFKPREKAAEEIKQRGGRMTSSVSSKTTRLLAGESPGSKIEKAEKLGIEVVSEEDFIKMISNI